MGQAPGTTPGILQAKSRMTGAGGAPASLFAGEFAWNSTDKVMYLGDGDNGAGVATSIVKLAGIGAFLAASLLGVANGVTPLDANNKVPLAYIPASLIGGLNYQGVWNAATNSPQLLSGQGTKGYYYKVGTAGTSVATTVGTAQGAAGTGVSVASAAGIAVGMLATGAGIPAGDTVTSINGTTVTLASATTVALAAGTSITFASYLDGSGGGTATVPLFNPGDMVAYNGTTWDKVDGPAEAVTTVAGRTGAIVLSSADLTDATLVGKSLLTAATLAAQRIALRIDFVRFLPDAAYQLVAGDYTVEFNALSATRAATLQPANAVTPGQRVRVGDFSGSASSSVNIAVTPSGTDKINGSAAPFAIQTAYGQVELMSDGVGNWNVMGSTAVTSTGIYGGTF